MAADGDVSAGRTALVLYGTETGTSQDLAGEVSRILERHHFDTDQEEFDGVSPQSLSGYTLVVFVLSTTGQGDFPSNARKFWTSLLKKKLPASHLLGVQFSLIGLGDSSYPKFNWAARKLDKRIKQLGAISLLDPCEADEQGEDSTDGAFILWADLFKSMLQYRFPLPTGVSPIAEGQHLPSKWTLSTFHSNGNVEADVNGSSQNGHFASITPNDISFTVTLEQNDRLTPTDHWQDVRFIRLKAQHKLEYLPGDALAIYPRNMNQDVESLINLMQWKDIADTSLRLQSHRNTSRSSKAPYPALSGSKTFTLRELLTNNLDINAIPRRSFFAAISQYTTDTMHKERLLEFTDPQYLDEYYDYATRPRRSILEILQEFDSVKVPWQQVINIFPMLRPRQFSVASGGKLKDGGSSYELLVAVVKYRTVIKRIREGVCTRYLAQLPVGSTLEVSLKTEGRFSTQTQLQQTNYLLIGAGTGVAPLRALIHEKENLSKPDSTTILVFGCRNEDADYFFRHEWQKIASMGNRLSIINAFSRDQKQKVYIQDRIRDHGDKVRQILHNQEGTIVVCGSSGAMPKAVRQALVDVICDKSQENPPTAEEAEQYLVKLEKAGRYKQETW